MMTFLNGARSSTTCSKALCATISAAQNVDARYGVKKIRVDMILLSRLVYFCPHPCNHYVYSQTDSASRSQSLHFEPFKQVMLPLPTPRKIIKEVSVVFFPVGAVS